MKKKIKLIIVLLTILSFQFMILFFISFNTITLKGDKYVSIPVFTSFEDPGYNSNGLVNIKSNLQEDKVGTYTIKYETKIGVFKFSKKRIVNVIDKESPFLVLEGSLDVIVCPNNNYKEEGYTAIDNYDGDISDEVVIDFDDEHIVYTITDSSGNKAVKKRNIIYGDTIPPELTLKGDDFITMTVNSEYEEIGYEVEHICDCYNENSVIVENNINTSVVGTYYLTYYVLYNNNVLTSKTRTVYVKPKYIVRNSTIYLTFDDGPSNVTPYVLNILKEQNIKATFFIMNTKPEYDYLIRRIVNEGHTLALHTYTHKYNEVYSSVEAYFEDLNKISDKVYDLTGIRSNMIRFPGGSSNTVSRQYRKGIMSELVKLVGEQGYKYYDWNVDSRDAESSYFSKEFIYNEVTSKMTSNSTNIVLMHDKNNNWNTANALEDIIIWGKNNGYSFDKITDSTPAIHHGIKN